MYALNLKVNQRVYWQSTFFGQENMHLYTVDENIINTPKFKRILVFSMGVVMWTKWTNVTHRDKRAISDWEAKVKDKMNNLKCNIFFLLLFRWTNIIFFESMHLDFVSSPFWSLSNTQKSFLRRIYFYLIIFSYCKICRWNPTSNKTNFIVIVCIIISYV